MWLAFYWAALSGRVPRGGALSGAPRTLARHLPPLVQGPQSGASKARGGRPSEAPEAGRPHRAQRRTLPRGWEHRAQRCRWSTRTPPGPARAAYLFRASALYRSRPLPKYFLCEPRASSWAAQVPCFSHSCFLRREGGRAAEGAGIRHGVGHGVRHGVRHGERAQGAPQNSAFTRPTLFLSQSRDDKPAHVQHGPRFNPHAQNEARRTQRSHQGARATVPLGLRCLPLPGRGGAVSPRTRRSARHPRTRPAPTDPPGRGVLPGPLPPCSLLWLAAPTTGRPNPLSANARPPVLEKNVGIEDDPCTLLKTEVL